jgi:hypothetical protein
MIKGMKRDDEYCQDMPKSRRKSVLHAHYSKHISACNKCDVVAYYKCGTVRVHCNYLIALSKEELDEFHKTHRASHSNERRKLARRNNAMQHIVSNQSDEDS